MNRTQNPTHVAEPSLTFDRSLVLRGGSVNPAVSRSQLREWVVSRLGSERSISEWIRYDGVAELYLRVNHRAVVMQENAVYRTICVSNIAVDTNLHGKGQFKRLLVELAEIGVAASLRIHIENVLTPRFAKHFEDRPGVWTRLHDVAAVFSTLQVAEGYEDEEIARMAFVPRSYIADARKVLDHYRVIDSHGSKNGE